MNQPDPMQYHRFARKLAFTYRDYHYRLSPDDLYQMAMIGLLELWRKQPEADPRLCFTAMRRAVLGELRRSMQNNPETAEAEPVRTILLPTPEAEALDAEAVQHILGLIEELPDKQFQAVILTLMGYSLFAVARDEGEDERKWHRNLSHARKKLRAWLATT